MGESILNGLPITLQAAMNPGSAPPEQGDASMEARNQGTLAPTPPMAPEGSQRPILPPGISAAAPAPPDITAPGDTSDTVHPIDAMASAFIGHLISKDQPEKPAPGSFASKLAGAAGALGTGLGDMRTGGDPSKGHGWLGAVGATLSARNERLEREKQQQFENKERLKNDQINIAKQNIEIRQYALAVQKQSKDIRDAGAAEGKAFIDELRDNYHTTDNINNDKLMEMMKKDPKFAQTHTARITGYEPILKSDGSPQLDQNNNPAESPLFSVVDLAPGDMSKQVAVSPTMAKRWSDAGVANVSAGTIMPVTAQGLLDAKALRYGTTLSILNHARVEALPADVRDQIATALQDSGVQHAIAMSPGNPLDGLYAAQKNVSDYTALAQQNLAIAQKTNDPQKVQAAQDALDHAVSTGQNLDKAINMGFTDAERAAYVKEKEADAKEAAVVAQNNRRDTETERHNRAMEGLQNPGGARGNVPISDGLKQQIDQLRQANPSAAAVLDTYDPTTQGALMAVAFGDGSVDLDKTFPARLTKGAPGINAQTALSVLKQINPNFSPQEYKALQEAYKTATTGKNAQAIQQYNNFIQHSSEAVDALASANRQGPRVWNMALNKLQNAGYGTDATKIQAALSGPRGEISLLLSGGYAPQAEESKAINTIMSDASTPGQLSAALQEYAALGTVRLDNINENYKRAANGRNLPRIIDQKTLDAAKHLGIEPQYMDTLQKLDSSGTMFGNQTPTGANVPQNAPMPTGATKIVIFGGQRYYTDNQGNNLGLVPKGQ